MISFRRILNVHRVPAAADRRRLCRASVGGNHRRAGGNAVRRQSTPRPQQQLTSSQALLPRRRRHATQPSQVPRQQLINTKALITASLPSLSRGYFQQMCEESSARGDGRCVTGSVSCASASRSREAKQLRHACIGMSGLPSFSCLLNVRSFSN